MVLVISILIIVALVAFGFFWHLLWLGVLVGVLALIARLAIIGLDPNRPAGRLNIGVLNSLGRYLVEISDRARHRSPRSSGTVEVVEVKVVDADATTAPTTGGTMTEAKTEKAVVLAEAGLTQAAIAEELGVSRSTVSRHLRRRRSSTQRSQRRRATS